MKEIYEMLQELSNKIHEIINHRENNYGCRIFFSDSNEIKKKFDLIAIIPLKKLSTDSSQDK